MDKRRFNSPDPNQLHLPSDEDLTDFLSRNDGEMRAAFAKARHVFGQRSGEYDEAILDDLRKLIAVRFESKIKVEDILKTSLFTATRIPKIRYWKRRTGNSVAHQFAEENDPPNRAEMLLHFGLPKRDRECMIGDLEEEYRSVILPKYGAGVAARWYWWQAVRSVAAAFGARVRVWLSFGGLARAAGWIVEKFTL